MKDQLLQALESIQNKRILLLGDVMLDKYVEGSVSRISPEAPVPVLHVKSERYVPGGASNVASNITALGGHVTVLGVVGNDARKDFLLAELRKRNINCDHLIIDGTRPTIEKTRMLSGSQHLLRVDYEDTSYINFNFEDQLFNKFVQLLEGTDCVVISDYAKGVITKRLMEKIIPYCKEKGKILLVDPKPKHKKYYVGATYVTPNHKELCSMVGKDVNNMDHAVLELGNQLSSELQTNVLLTRGEKGMTYVPTTGDGFTIATKAKEVFDVSGAGDTVVAALSLALSAGIPVQTACALGNHAAGIVVGKLGTSTVTADELRNAIQSEYVL
jgi:D-glycero-beta-D-manno-heptose-7-phosphate kinase